MIEHKLALRALQLYLHVGILGEDQVQVLERSRHERARHFVIKAAAIMLHHISEARVAAASPTLNIKGLK